MRKTGLGKHFTVLLAALLAFHHLGIAQSTQTQEMFRASRLKASVQERGRWRNIKSQNEAAEQGRG
jgi:hypothetical protein